jgi:hypothetical protein
MPFSIRPYHRVPLPYFSGFCSLLMLLLLCSGPAYAEWEKITGDDQGDMSVYVKPDTVRRSEEMVKMWTLYDFKTMQPVGDLAYLSIKERAEYDCDGERTRTLTGTNFSGNMGGGRAVRSTSREGTWRPVLQESVAQDLWEFACAKKLSTFSTEPK